jgi:hypothetical protein
MKDKLYNMYDVTDKIIWEINNEEDEIFVIHYRNPIELEYEKLKVKFGNRLIKYLTDIKNDGDYFNRIYENFFTLWRKVAIEKNSMSLFILINYLTKRESYNIKKSIFSSVTNENLKEPIYYKFINDFIGL